MTMNEQMSSAQVLDRLRNGPFQAPAHVMLCEVNNATGWRGGRQFADALVVSCWPSRGIWFAGVEVKVSRSDWTREVRDPDKSSEIQAFCDFWWIAAPKGVVPVEELPPTWGLLEIEGKKVRKTKDAPKLEPKPLTQAFVASVLRNAAEGQERVRLAASADGYQRAKAEFGAEGVAQLRQELTEAKMLADRLERDVGYKKNDLASLEASIRKFEIAAGLPEHTITQQRFSHHWDVNVGAQFKAAQLLASMGREKLAQRFSDVAEALLALPDVKPEAT